MSVANVVMLEFETNTDLENWADYYKTTDLFLTMKYLCLSKQVKHLQSEQLLTHQKKPEKQVVRSEMIYIIIQKWHLK